MKFNSKQEFMSEMIGTLILVLIGCGSIAMVELFSDSKLVAHGGYINIALGWCLGLTLGVFISAKVSGAHLNPAVTIAMAMVKKLPWCKVPHYIIGQIFGAFVAAATVFFVYHAQWLSIDPSLSHTTGILATFPSIKTSLLPGLFDQILGTMLLVIFIMALTDQNNTMPQGNMFPLFIGLGLLAIATSFGGLHGFAINPARDFAPRLFALMAGFKNTGFERGIWLIPVVAPIIGGCIGAKIYEHTIGKYLKKSQN